jgi:hypothetical protein
MKCQFCGKAIRSLKAAFFDDGHCHELCWWKRECARLQAEIDAIKDEDTRNAQHDLGSEPTVLSEQPQTDLLEHQNCYTDTWDDDGGR